MNCPKCYTKISKLDVNFPLGTITVNKCHGCDGVWVDGNTLERLIINEPSAPSYENLVKVINQDNLPKKTESCPTCEDENLYLLSIQGVDLDYCKKCNGMYFDRGELEGIIPKNEYERKFGFSDLYCILDTIGFLGRAIFS